MAANIGYSPSVIACPSCPKCGTRMVLIHIFPDRTGGLGALMRGPISEAVIIVNLAF